MKIFMGNLCGYGYCMKDDCESCPHWTPTIFNIKLPKWKWLIRLFYRIESGKNVKSKQRF